jgi:hypothetical protein
MIDDDLAAALREFAARIAALDPPGSPAVVELTVGGAPVALTVSAARALAEAALAYHDPRDRGACDHCGSRRIDDNFVCADCMGRPLRGPATGGRRRLKRLPSELRESFCQGGERVVGVQPARVG